MSNGFSQLFRDHPREVGEGYFEHMAAATRFGCRLLSLASAAFVHAVVPGWHKATVSAEICRMAQEMGGRADEARDCRMRDAGAWDPGL